MSRKGKRSIRAGTAAQLPALLVLAVFFLLGVILGQVFAGRVPAAAGEELERYLSDFLRLDAQQTGPEVFGLTLLLYFRYPLAALLLGFASIGVILLPCATVLFGLMLSFSVSCFTAAFGGDGVLLALAVFGLRCLVTAPCYFLTAAFSLQSSAALASLSFGKGRRTAPVRFGSWYRAAATGTVLLVGVCVDMALSPALLHLALEHMAL